MQGRYILVILFICVSNFAPGQYLLPQATPKSPNVAGFEKYGAIPVSMSTGVPNITIPLTSITVDGLTIPITLRYHNTGLKVDEFASMMGLGFDLEFGGVISYNQKGTSDFDPQFNGLMVNAGSRQDLADYLAGNMNDEQRYTYFEHIIHEEEDSQIDFYSFNFLGNSGSFYFDPSDASGKAIVVPESDLAIYKTQQGIKIIDNNGNEFYFEDAEGAYSYDEDETYIMPSFGGISAWHLTRIVTKNGREIRYKYKPYELRYSKTFQVINHAPDRFNVDPSCPQSSITWSDNLITQAFILPDEIDFDQGTVKFETSTDFRQDLLQIPLQSSIPSLSGFYIVNSNGKKVNEFTFTQGYFGGNARLKLSAVQQKVDNEAGKKWEFSYYGESDNFPPIYSKSKDHWGYYNGKTNTSLIPAAEYRELFANWQDYLAGGYGDRTSDFNYSKLGLLQTIKYPTGGTTTFEFEPHQVKVNDIDDILQYPFLQWSSNSLPTHTVPVAGNNTIYSGNITASFTLAKKTVVHATAFIENDPSSLSSARIDFTGPEAGIDQLYHLIQANCTTNSCTGVDDLVLPAGTYTYSLTKGFDYNLNRELHCNLEITKQEYDISGGIPPFEAGGARISKITSTDPFTGQTTTKKYIYDDRLNQVEFRNIPYYISSRDNGIAAPPVSDDVPSTYCIPCNTMYAISSESVRPFAGPNIEYKHVTELDDLNGVGGKTEYDFLTSTNEGGSIAQPYLAPLNTNWRIGTPLAQRIYKYDNGNYTLVKEIDNGYNYYSGKLKLLNGIKVEYERYCPIGTPAERAYRTALETWFTELFYLNQTTSKEIFSNTITNTQNITAGSANHTLPTLIESTDSKKQSVTEKTIYSFDYNRSFSTTSADNEALAIQQFVAKNILLPVEKIQIKTIGNTDYVVGGTLYTYRADKPVIDKVYALKIGAPLLYASFTSSAITNDGKFIKDGNYEEKIVEAGYDEFNNITEQAKTNDVKNAFIWDYKKYYPVADVKNAEAAAIAYTSFEADGAGNWNIPGANRAANGVTGVQCYQLNNGAITKSGLASSGTYVVSYWSKNGACSVTGTVGSTMQGKTVTVNGINWTYYEHQVTGVNEVTVSGTADIDELRLYPGNAQMTTYTYEPLVGMTSQCDARNTITYYEYDALGRLNLVRDQDGNIIKTFKYNYKQ